MADDDVLGRHLLLQNNPSLQDIADSQESSVAAGHLAQRVNLASYSVDDSGHVLMLAAAPAAVSPERKSPESYV